MEKNKIKAQVSKVLRKILKYIFLTFVTLLVMYNIIYIFNNIFRQKKYIQIFGIYISTEKENTMSPKIKHNSLVIGIKTKNVNVQDIVGYENGETLTYHRIIRINNDNGKTKYVTKSDNNFNPDIEEKSLEQIKSKLIINLPVIGFFFRIFESKITTVFIIIGLLLRYNYNNYKIKMSKKRRKEVRQ